MLLPTSRVGLVSAGALTVTMVTRDLVLGTRVGHACVLEAREVDISTAILVGSTHARTESSVTAAWDIQVLMFLLFYFHYCYYC